MISDTGMRIALWLGTVFNAGAALMLACPAMLGALVGLPAEGPVFYRWLLAWFVALFGAAYAWLALQPTISRLLVTLAALGKSGVFVIALACWSFGEIGFRTLAVALGDLMFALVFFLWLLDARNEVVR